jgi:hypothetical protein
MSRTADQLLSEVLKLPDDQRAALVAEILKTLPPAVPRSERGNEEWLAEVERRARQALAGSPGILWEDALSEARSKLKGE